jgi:hypothetical protein
VICQFVHHKSHTDWPDIEHWPQPLETGDKPHKPEHSMEFFFRFQPWFQANNFIVDQCVVLLPVDIPENWRKSKNNITVRKKRHVNGNKSAKEG